MERTSPYSPPPRRPKIVCLCGSTRFMDAFAQANRDKTLAGEIVLTVAVDFKTDTTARQEDKVRLDELHLRKIDLADYVHIINVGGYIGEGTKREIAYAQGLHKPVTYLEPL